MKNIIIFGAPGSGKGTYSAEIAERYGMGHISTGDVLRGEIKNETELGKVAKGYIDQGQLIPDELMIDILAKTYDALPAGKGVIFDGFPRTIAQAEALKKMLAERGHGFEAEGIRFTFDWGVCKTKEGMLDAIFQEIEKQNS